MVYVLHSMPGCMIHPYTKMQHFARDCIQFFSDAHLIASTPLPTTTDMAKRATKAPKDDFVLTIDSDSEGESRVPDLDEESEEEEEAAPVAPTKGKKKGKKAKAAPTKLQEAEEAAESADLNPEFQFQLDDMESAAFDGWDFQVAREKESEGVQQARKDVDLDGILRRKGGLMGQHILEAEAAAEAAETADASGDEGSGDEGSDAGDDDDLALDGFGMGAEEDEEEDEEEEEEEEQREEAEAMEAPSGEEDADADADTAEQMAAFYADDKENASASASVPSASFAGLQLSRPVLKGLAHLGYTKPSPIQAAAIPIALLGKDIVAGAQTGSGKTAAYMVPIIERLLYKPAAVSATRVVVLTPTRELSIQVCEVGKRLGRFVHNMSFGLAVGGLNLRQQEQQLKTRPDVVIATPGRLIDHIRNLASFTLDALEVLVIDEADRMLDEGFQAELTEILLLVPKHQRQTMLFSATMNTKIQDLIQLLLQRPVRVMIDPPKSAANKLVQEFVRIRKREHLKPALLLQLLRAVDPRQQSRVVVFVARKETAHRLRVVLGLMGLKVLELHGALLQEQRLQNVTDFRNLVVPVLLCTDLAARGLDIPKIEVVINYDMPKSHEVYLHRVGRTARAGRDGRSITFVGELTQDRAIVKAAIRSLAESEDANVGRAVLRRVDWAEVEELNVAVEAKQAVVEEVLEEEALAKEMLQAEMELAKASNIMAHGKEIAARPRRTWFELERDKRAHKTPVMHQLTKQGKQVNLRKRKAHEDKKERGARLYKKTREDRMSKPKPKGKGKK